MKDKFSGCNSPQTPETGTFAQAGEKPVVREPYFLYIWPPVVQLDALDRDSRKLLLWIFGGMLIMILLLAGLDFYTRNQASPRGLVPPRGYPPAQLCT
jgi:hypothetical protein